jgi:hypothetical protein
MQMESGRMCWWHATVRPDRSEAATSAPNPVVIGLVHAIHSSSAVSTAPVHHQGEPGRSIVADDHRGVDRLAASRVCESPAMPGWTRTNFGELRDVSPRDVRIQWRFARDALGSPSSG